MRSARGRDIHDLFGTSLAACDLNGDGTDEVVVGAPQFADGDAVRGRAFVLDLFGPAAEP